MRKYLFLLLTTVLTFISIAQSSQKLPGNSKILYFGDSQTSYGYTSGTNSAQFQNFGYIAWVNALAPSVYMPKGGMLGVAGETTGQMLNRIGALQSLGAKIIVVAAGTNDPLYGITTAATKANLRKIYDAGIAAGMKVIAITIMPRFGQNAYSATNETNRKAINAWMKLQTDIVVVDVESDLDDPIYFDDGLHNSNLGAYIVGNRVAAEVNQLVTQCQANSFTAQQLGVAGNSNPLMTGSTGRLDNATGAAATNWQLAALFASTARVVGSKEPDGNGNEKQVINIAGTYTGSTRKVTFINNAVGAISLANGDVVEGFSEVEVSMPMVGIKSIYLSVQITNAEQSVTLSQGYSMWPTSLKPNYMPPGKYVLRTPPLTIGNGAAVGKVISQIVIEFNNTTTTDPVSAELKISNAGIVKLPLADGPIASFTPTGDVSLCAGATKQLTATAGNGYTYQWMLDGNGLKDSTTNSIIAKEPGTYTVMVNTPGCNVLSNAAVLAPGRDCQQPPAIQAGSLPATLCNGQPLSIPFTTTGTFDAGTVFTAQLSDGSGSFANPVEIGTAAGVGTIAATLPAELMPATGYRIRVVSTNPVVAGTDNGHDIHIASAPQAAINPAGIASTFSSQPVTLAANQQAGLNYQWLLNNSPIIQDGTANTYTPLASGIYRVVVSSPEGCSDTSEATIVTIIPCESLLITATGTDTTSFSFNVSGGIPPYQYSLDSVTFQAQNTFFGFRSSHTYILYVKDSAFCAGKLVFQTKAAQSISFASLPNRYTHEAPFALNATASSELPVSYRIVSGPATLNGNTLTLNGEGVVTVEAAQEGNASYYAAPVVTHSFTVVSVSTVKTDQAISFASLPDRTFGDGPVALAAAASSGLAVSYRVVSGPAVINGGDLVLTGAGSVTIEASQVGDDSFNPAPPVTQSFTVNKASQTITFGSLANKTFGDTAFLLSATATSGLPAAFRLVSGPAILAANTVTITGAGTIIIEALQNGDSNYHTAPTVTQSFTVVKAVQTISFGALAAKSYGDAPFAINATATSGLPVFFRVVSGTAAIAGNTVTLLGTGEISIEASQAGNENIEAASPVVQTFLVQKAVQTISFTAIAGKTYGEAPFAVTATATSGLPVGYRIVSGPATLSGNTLTLTGAGTVSVEATQAGNDYHNAATPVVQQFAVAKASQVINFPSILNKVYGDVPFALNATASSGLPVMYRVISGPASIMGNVVTLSAIGTVIIEAFQTGDVNFNAATAVQRSFLVTASNTTKLNQSITFGSLAYRTCTSAPFALNASASSGLPVTYRVVTGPITISGNMVTITGTGLATIEALQPGDGTYNPAAPVQRSFTIGKGSQTITFLALSGKTYGEAPFALTATASSGLPVMYRIVSGPATISGSTIAITGVGTVTVEASQPGNANYNAAYNLQRSFAVVKAAQTLTFPTIYNKTNDDPPFALGAIVSSGLPVLYRIKSGPASVSGNMVSILGVGTVTVEASQPGDVNHYAAAPVTRSFSVVATQSVGQKLGQAINFDPLQNRIFGDAPFQLNASASSGLPVSYSVVAGPAVINGNAVTLTGAGTVTIEASQSGDVTYNAAPTITRSFTVDKGTQVLNFPAISNKTYGDQPFAVYGSSTSGLPLTFRIVSGPAVITSNTVTLISAGVVTIEATQAGDATYNPALPVQRSFTVLSAGTAKQNQTITFASIGYKTYISPAFALSATASSGLPVNFRVVSGPVTLNGSTVTITGIGSATIEATQAGNASFHAAPPVQRSFTIGKTSQTISFAALTTKTYGDPPFALTATASSGMPVSYRIVSGPATVAGNTVTLTGVGTVTVEASQPGNAYYNAAVSLQRSFAVNVPATIRQTGIIAANNGSIEPRPVHPPMNTVHIFPNPATAETVVAVTVAQPARGVLAIYNLQGKLLKVVANRYFKNGNTDRFTVNVAGLAGGTYVLRLTANGKTLTQLLQIVR